MLVYVAEGWRGTKGKEKKKVRLGTLGNCCDYAWWNIDTRRPAFSLSHTGSRRRRTIRPVCLPYVDKSFLFLVGGMVLTVSSYTTSPPDGKKKKIGERCQVKLETLEPCIFSLRYTRFVVNLPLRPRSARWIPNIHFFFFFSLSGVNTQDVTLKAMGLSPPLFEMNNLNNQKAVKWISWNEGGTQERWSRITNGLCPLFRV